MKLSPHIVFSRPSVVKRRYLFFTAVSILLPFGYLSYTASVFPTLADEGFLWSNALFAFDGLVPIRDFQSYDPGRYYFCAPFILIFGRGILSVRIAMAAVQASSIFCLLYFLDRRSPRGICALTTVFTASSMLLWHNLYHKSIDISMAIYLVCLLAWFIESSCERRFFLCGLFTGFSAFIGRNHAVYALISFFAAYCMLLGAGDRERAPRRVLTAAAGIIAGFSPMLLMYAFVPGYFKAYLDVIIGMFTRGYSNIAIPVIWIWNAGWSFQSGDFSFITQATGLFFTLAPPFLAGFGIFAVWKSRIDLRAAAGTAACAIVGLVYLHYAFSRADLGHISHGFAPVMALATLRASQWEAHPREGLKKLASRAAPVLASVLIFTYSALGIGSVTKARLKYLGAYPMEIALPDGAIMQTDEATYRLVCAVQDIISTEGAGNGEILFAPYLPGMYAVTGLHSPVRDTYFLHPASMERQREIVNDLKGNGVFLVILAEISIDGREDLFLRNLYPHVYTQIMENYKEIPSDLQEPYRLYKKIESS